MKLQFDKDLSYQKQAVAAVVDLFKGQTLMQANFTVTDWDQQIGMLDTGHGVGNKRELDEAAILKNLQAVQLRYGLAQTKMLGKGKYDFAVEMETGTGKTYVYLRTILELNKNYGFTKFIIVVPSIAIKEGVYKSLQVTKEHFKDLYDNCIYEFFIYHSEKLEQVRNFAVSDNIQIMIINIDAFRKSFENTGKESKANIIHRRNDRMNGMKPIELIRETNPIVIIDEPQSVDTTPKSKEAIKSLNPLCTLRYSATHVDKHNLVYKLDSVDAYELGLVKQIEVAGLESKDYHNNAYLKLVSVDNKKSPITAKIEIDVHRKGQVQRKTVTVKQGDNLYEKSGSRDVYQDYIVNEIYCVPGQEYVNFTSKQEILRIGLSLGDIDDLAIKRQQIRKTIEEHLDKELRFKDLGVKVLSLFFIDRVANYRYYDEQGNPRQGKYAIIFEEEYKDLITLPKYRTLLGDIDVDSALAGVHNGYFSQDKKGTFKDTSGKSQADEDAYNLILRDKEKLLSFATKLRFIFSHSTLREGWDNPNVFQICTLNETSSEVKKRQEIGRGLRLCVNQQGERLRGFGINILTVMANESYESFAKGLQEEIEREEGIKFGVIETHFFANLSLRQPEGDFIYLGREASEQLYKFFVAREYIDVRGKVQDKLKTALKNNALELPKAYESARTDIVTLVKKVSGTLPIKNTADRQKVSLNKQVFLSEEFNLLWDKIKYKTTYAVDFDSKKLIDKCCGEIQNNVRVEAARLIYTKATLDIAAGGVATTEKKRESVLTTNLRETLPDIISFLQNETSLTRRTIVDILLKSNTLHLFKKNPQKYMDKVAKIISTQMRLFIVDGIKYTKIGDKEYYAQELFQDKELFGYLSKNMLESSKSVYQYVIYDSANEAGFAERFEHNPGVKLYAKLPNWFKISTPLGSYNPDWAVLIEKNGEQKLYFVLETKATILPEALRPTEYAKMKCGYKHFEELGHGVAFKDVDNFKTFIEEV
ncbi:type III restriction-modification system endonuclease [Desulforamulus aeronauticus]|uniref:Type III restriction enzyme n=1 Tax=Desulforamulus aeronauticus DSM 10349 TaxID=1121421 RepID=A0A1M6NYI5_9FIRM|nr:DEAD/DEAH box helicase family protein [Desulforamulus aeronauticus]SHK00710.1 type III restriction enzyme [Desulforamulus aeronauticus DSM 10349]